MITSHNAINDAYRSVQNYLTSEYGRNSVKPEHVKTITLEAFEQLKQKDSSLKKLKGKKWVLNSDQRRQLLEIVKEMVVSPFTPWKLSPEPGSPLSQREKSKISSLMR